jgi:hypothetical protein
MTTFQIPKLCIEVGKFGLLTFGTLTPKSPLVKIADAFEVKTPRHLALLHDLRRGSAAASTEEQQKLRVILETGKEVTYHHSGVIDTGFTEGFVASGHVDLLDPAGIEYASFSLGPSCLRIARRDAFNLSAEGVLSREELWVEIHNRLQTLKTRFRGQLGFENELYQPDGGVEHITEPAFLTEFFRLYPNVLFLLDLSHSRVAAAAFQTDALDYLRNLPLDRVGHIHISHPQRLTAPGEKEPRLMDAHEAPQENDLHFLEQALSLGAKPKYITIEYFRNEEGIIESNLRLKQMFTPTYRLPLTRNLIWLDLGIRAVRERLSRAERYDHSAVSAALVESFHPPISRVMQEVLGLYQRTELAESADGVASHTARVYLAYLQADSASFDDLSANPDPHQLERLAADKSRGRQNFEAIKKRAGLFPAAVWETLIALHDLGKVVQLPSHDRSTGKMLIERRLLDRFPYPVLSSKDKALVTEVVEHHGCYGITFLGDGSPLIFKEVVFSCPGVKKLLINPDGSVNLKRVKRFIDLWSTFAMFDSAGVGPKGIISNSRVEYWLFLADKLYEVFEKNQTSYETALKELENLAQGSFSRRICGILGSADTELDGKLPPLTRDDSHLIFYTERIQRAREKLLERGEISEADWKELENNFYKILELPYIANFYTVAWSDPGVDRSSPRAEDEIYPGFLKYLVLLNRAASDKFGPPCNEIRVIPHGKKVVRLAHDQDEHLPAIREVIDRARGLVRKGNKLYFADEKGQIIEGSPLMHRKGKALMVDFSSLL